VEPPAEALGALAATPRDRRVGGAGDADSGGRIGPPQSSIVTGLWVRRECDSTEQRLTSKNRMQVVEISPRPRPSSSSSTDFGAPASRRDPTTT
jgi:hypothetical protein